MIFAGVSAIVTANAYYVHPIIALVAEDFGVSDAVVGIVPAFNQIALALGIFLLLPLGDWLSNRLLVSLFVAGQTAALLIMAVAHSFGLFVAGSTLLGFFTIAPYLLPAYVSKRVEGSKLGHATAILTAGIIAGILVARAGAGFIGEYFDWRTVYFIAAALMLLISIALPFIMEGKQQRVGPETRQNYFSLIFSILAIVRRYPEILLSGAIQGLNFGIFLAVWMGLGLHLTSEAMGYGVDVVGYLAVLTLFNLFLTPRFGRWADRIGPRRARFIMACFQLLGVALLSFTGHSLWLLIVPIMIMNVCGPVMDVTGRMTFLSEPPDVRTRLMTVYIVMMFIGAGGASWAGTASYHFGGWHGVAGVALAFSLLAVGLAFLSFRWKKR